MAGKTGTAQVRRISMSERAGGVLQSESLAWRMRDHSPLRRLRAGRQSALRLRRSGRAWRLGRQRRRALRPRRHDLSVRQGQGDGSAAADGGAVGRQYCRADGAPTQRGAALAAPEPRRARRRSPPTESALTTPRIHVPAPIASLPWKMLSIVLALTGFGLLILYSAAGGHMTWALPQGIRFVMFLGMAIAMSLLSTAILQGMGVPRLCRRVRHAGRSRSPRRDQRRRPALAGPRHSSACSPRS